MPLQQDVDLALKKRLVLPAPDTPGSVLTAQNDGSVAWGPHLDRQILEGAGDPNGVQFSYLGRLYTERDTGDLWRNTDGVSAWEIVGSTASFPLSQDDGTNTYTVHTDAGFGQVTMSNKLDSNNAETDFFSFVDTGVASGEISCQWPSGGNSHVTLDAGSDFGDAELKCQTSASDAAAVTLSADVTDTPKTSATVSAGNVSIAASVGLAFRAATPIALPTVTGSRGGNAALASLLTALANYGLIVDSSS